MFTYKWDFCNEAFPDGVPPVVSPEELWASWRAWAASKKQDLGAKQSTSTLERSLRCSLEGRMHIHWKINLEEPLDKKTRAVFTFHGAPASRVARTRARVQLCHVPPPTHTHAHTRSPDLNPVEMFWGWLRKRLQKMDLADLQAGREPVDRSRLKARVRSLVETRRAKTGARHCFLSLLKTCEKVRRKRGAASGA